MDSNEMVVMASSILSKVHNDLDWFCYDALNSAEPMGRQLKPWANLDSGQRAVIVQLVNDMSLYRAERKVDPNDADLLFEGSPELRALLD